MPRIAAIDFGTKRTGVAISDPLCMIANGLETAETKQLLPVLQALYQSHTYETLVIGEPKRMDGSASQVEVGIMEFIEKFRSAMPHVRVDRIDERFTSKIAMQTMVAAGSKRSQRREKGNVDKISATLILQEYLNKQ